MTRITWSAAGQKRWERGVDHGVLFLRDSGGEYTEGYPWVGLTTVTESPSGAESNKQYADNDVYANLKSREEFGATIEAFAFPDQFARCNGDAEPIDGLTVGQQGRETFGFAYRVLQGNDLTEDLGEKIKLVYGADAAPSEQTNTTVNADSEIKAFSWEVTTTPVEVPGTNPLTGREYRKTATLTLDSTKIDEDIWEQLTDILYGTVSDDPRLPLPEEVISILGGATVVDMADGVNKPTFVDATGVLTLPAVTGVQWKVNGANVASGVKAPVAAGVAVEVDATPLADYTLVGETNFSFRRDV